MYEIIKKEESKSLKDYKVIIACSIIKEQKMDYLLQKATELGADEIIPIISERTIVKVKQASSKIDRWNRIIKESVEQCHRVSIPIIKDIIQDIMGDKVTLINTGEEAALYARKCLREKNMLNNQDKKGKNVFYVSDSVELFTENVKNFLSDDMTGEVYQEVVS